MFVYGCKEIKICGLDLDYILILVNGRCVNFRDVLIFNYLNDFDLLFIFLVVVDWIEVVCGLMLFIYGVDVLGGVVNIILKKFSE